MAVAPKPSRESSRKTEAKGTTDRAREAATKPSVRMLLQSSIGRKLALLLIRLWTGSWSVSPKIGRRVCFIESCRFDSVEACYRPTCFGHKGLQSDFFRDFTTKRKHLAWHCVPRFGDVSVCCRRGSGSDAENPSSAKPFRQGEEVPLCPRCSLPVGEFAYQGREGKQSCVHTECMAQVMSQEAQREEDARVKRENVKKEKNRREYDIGWRMGSVPKSAPWAERMGCRPAPQGLCCLVLDEASRTVKVAATAEPFAAVNLEYLLLALKVRKTASREPLFSLDPVDPQNLEKTPQKKVYEPSWLAGTSVGDVMFQADYFLKELALGEYDMPAAASAQPALRGMLRRRLGQLGPARLCCCWF